TGQNQDVSQRLRRLEIRLFEIEESLRWPHRQAPTSTSAPVPSPTKDVGLQVGPSGPAVAVGSPGPIIAALPHPQPAISSAPTGPGEPAKSSVPLTTPAPPVAPRPPPPHRAPPSPPRPAIEWERWLGVRGAAVLGGAVFILAGILFFKY